MFWNNNEITKGLKLQVNSLSNQLSSVRDNFRQAMLGISHNGKRDINEIYGYPANLSGEDGFRLMYDMAKREGIANKLTFGTARTCWRSGFEVFDGQDEDANEVLEDEISKLTKKLLINKLERADILNRIGQFSVLFVGIPDGRESCDPVGPVSGDGFKSIYFKPFAYDGIQINKLEDDPKNPRFGLPLLYQVQKMNRGDIEKDTELSAMIVHHSRIIHMNEGALDSDVEGMAYLEPIFNRITDINKAIGGSSEYYFRNAKGKIVFEVDKDFASSSLDQTNKDKMDEGAKKFTNDGQDHIFAAGAKAYSINTPHASPVDTVKVALWEIAGYSGYPIRVLTGEGSGQLAGSEDQLALNAIISDRQETVCTNWVIALFEILAMASMVEWKDTYDVRFPKQEAVTEMQQVEINHKKADTLLKAANAKSQVGGDEIDFRSALDELGLKEIKTDSLPPTNDIIE